MCIPFPAASSINKKNIAPKKCPSTKSRRRRTISPTTMRSFHSSWIAPTLLLLTPLLLSLFPSVVVVQGVPIHLHGLNYNTRKGPDWDWDKCKSRTEILTDLTLLSRITNRIRILSLTDCGQAELVLDVVKELGMQLWLGMWVAPEEFVFEEERGELIGLLERGRIDEDHVLGISVGSEAIYRNDSTVDEMIAHMNDVYGLLRDAGLDIPVTIVDIAPEYAKSSKLRSAVNVTMTNTFPFWEAIPIDEAIDDLVEDLTWLMSQQESRSKPFVLGETGWPGAGFLQGVGVAGSANQKQYFEESFCTIDVEKQWSYYWFTGIDNAWRQEQDPDNTIEGTWGFMYANLTLKPHFQDLEFRCSDGVTYSFAEIDWTIPQYTPAPSTLDPASCQAHRGCSGLFGTCCPGSNGLFLNCCDPLVTSPPAASPAAPTTTAKPTTRAPVISPSPTAKPTTRAPVISPSPTTKPTTRAPVISPLPTTLTPQESLSPGGSTTTESPTKRPTTQPPTKKPTMSPTTSTPTLNPTMDDTTIVPEDDESSSPTGGPTSQPTTVESPSMVPSSTPSQLADRTPKPTIEIVFRPSPPPTRSSSSSRTRNNNHNSFFSLISWSMLVGLAWNL